MTHFVLNGKKGYTLLELMLVVAIVGILVSLAIPNFQQSAMKAKETALKQNLFTMRAVLDQYYADREEAKIEDKGFEARVKRMARGSAVGGGK